MLIQLKVICNRVFLGNYSENKRKHIVIINKNNDYKLSCGSCPKVFIGQTGVINGTSDTKYAEYLT